MFQDNTCSNIATAIIIIIMLVVLYGEQIVPVLKRVLIMEPILR